MTTKYKNLYNQIEENKIKYKEVEKINIFFAKFLGYFYEGFNENNKDIIPGWKLEGYYKIHPKIQSNYFLARRNRDLPFHRNWNYLLKVLTKANQNKMVTIYRNEIYRSILENNIFEAASYIYTNIKYEESILKDKDNE